jgi:S-methylmethionine-dependent homocysteine/selenocysteine methylase
MPSAHSLLPQLANRLFLTDGGIETTLIFHEGIDLPLFAAFHLLRNAEGTAALVRYYKRYLAIAEVDQTGFILESPTWRASKDWGRRLGYRPDDIAAVNRTSILLMQRLRAEHIGDMSIVVSGCVGPRRDGYDPGALMSPQEAADYHSHQIEAFADAGADLVSAITMTNVEEAIGIAQAARRAALSVAISFTVETDGGLPTGHSLAQAIDIVDAATEGSVAYYMINCAHPTHFADCLPEGATWTRRIRGIRANASARSHQELNDAPDLDAGDPLELAGLYRDLLRRHPHITILGGCCGTDHRHVECISLAVRTAA